MDRFEIEISPEEVSELTLSRPELTGWGMAYEDGRLVVPEDKAEEISDLIRRLPALRHERELTELRRERDRRLAASDWTQLADAPLTDKQRSAWAAYRRKLRDLPEAAGAGFPAEPGRN